MTAKDIFHDIVKRALVKDGWTITHDPLYLRPEGSEFYIDLGAEKLLAAEKGTDQIAIEIKGFLNPSAMYDFHMALGQMMNYRLALKLTEPSRILFIAIPRDTYDAFFQLSFVQRAIQEFDIRLIVFDPDLEEIVQWIP